MTQTKTKDTTNLFNKYDQPGPRYTSYPTVPYWSPNQNPSPEKWIHEMRNQFNLANKKDVGASIYIHVPYCRSQCSYCGCNTQILKNNQILENYVDCLLTEWNLYQRNLQLTSPIKLEELHLGGGSPNILSHELLTKLIEGISKDVTMGENQEFSIEVDPRNTTLTQLQLLRTLDFRRISIGVQDFDPKVMKIINRVQSFEQVSSITQAARKLGFHSINFDLIFGLPLQTEETTERTFELVKQLKPDRIAYYSYAHVPWIKPSQRLFSQDEIPTGEQKRKLYELGRSLLLDFGYQEIGMDHFALEQDSLYQASIQNKLHRNFMGYTNKERIPLIGLGASSIGDTWTAFAQNEKITKLYQQKIENGILPIFHGHLLDPEDQILRRHILNIMTKFHTQWNDNELWTDWLDNVPVKLAELEKDQLVMLTPTSCTVTKKGRPFLRNICMAFDAKLGRIKPKDQLFSKTV